MGDQPESSRQSRWGPLGSRAGRVAFLIGFALMSPIGLRVAGFFAGAVDDLHAEDYASHPALSQAFLIPTSYLAAVLHAAGVCSLVALPLAWIADRIFDRRPPTA